MPLTDEGLDEPEHLEPDGVLLVELAEVGRREHGHEGGPQRRQQSAGTARTPSVRTAGTPGPGQRSRSKSTRSGAGRIFDERVR